MDCEDIPYGRLNADHFSVTIASVDLDGNIRYIAELDVVVAAFLNDRIDVDVRARPPRVVERRNSDRAAVALLYGPHAATESKRRHVIDVDAVFRMRATSPNC